LTKAT